MSARKDRDRAKPEQHVRAKLVLLGLEITWIMCVHQHPQCLIMVSNVHLAGGLEKVLTACVGGI